VTYTVAQGAGYANRQTSILHVHCMVYHYPTNSPAAITQGNFVYTVAFCTPVFAGLSCAYIYSFKWNWQNILISNHICQCKVNKVSLSKNMGSCEYKLYKSSLVRP